ncbi:NAD(P)/FAD-dependent oxidoreductase [Nocardia sp. NPDC059180]|uniref:NAD(P)/FAD-dependent oxidoreductase n=1 Tax=Nocardia sp. NPDC059180 TaxID=3346761 RepID=UPI0036C03774
MKIAVIGAGYAGTLAANRLARKVKTADITLINPRTDFVERVRLHQQLAGSGTAATPLTAMLRDGINTHLGTVDKIGDGTLGLDDGTRIDFDYAVLAVGSTVTPMPGTVPIGIWEGAERARTALAGLPEGSTVTVIGGGATGIETAAEIAGARPDIRVRIIGSSVAGGFSEGAHERVRSGLQRLHVDIVDDDVTEVTAGTGEYDGVVQLRSGTALTSDLTLWAIVSDVPELATRSGLATDLNGRVIVDEYLRSITDERIVAAGDCAAVPGSRMSCYNAQPQGTHAAETVARMITGRNPKPYSWSYVARAVTLGRNDAVLQLTHRDDTLRRTYFTGRPAVVLKELTSRGGKFNSRSGGLG